MLEEDIPTEGHAHSHQPPGNVCKKTDQGVWPAHLNPLQAAKMSQRKREIEVTPTP